MLRSIKNLQRFSVSATDGPIGHVDALYFDDERWTVRYLVVDTASWRLGRLVLVSPRAIRHIDWSARTVALSITRDQVRNSPDIDTRRPVSRQHEAEFLRYYHYPHYWGTPGWTIGGLEELRAEEKANAAEDSHLRSTREVLGSHVHALDGELGHVDDFLVDDESWAIRDVVVDTNNWWFGRKVLVAPESIHEVKWPDRKVFVALPRRSVKHGPPYEADASIEQQWEADHDAHHRRADTEFPAQKDRHSSA
ncbi:MAG: PRC-barrel domain containing protein [Acidobacteria bacterium]|nr:MAG: PRC-barrel domain containing protein [Acidobacteriota bacterium]